MGEKTPLGRIIGVISSKGGVGKSSIVVNVAVALKMLGFSVVIIDADKQKTMAEWYENRLANDNNQENEIDIVEVLDDIVPTLIYCAERYDYVLIDTAGRDTREFRLVLMKAHIIYFPTEDSDQDKTGMEQNVEALEETKDFNPTRILRAIVNKASTNYHHDDHSTIQETLKNCLPVVPLSDKVLYDRKAAFRRDFKFGRSVVEGKDVQARDEMMAFAEELVSHG